MKVFYDLVHGEPFVDCSHPMDVLGKNKPNCMVLQIFFVSCVVCIFCFSKCVLCMYVFI